MAKETVKVGFRLTAVACICVWTSIYTEFSQNAEPLAIQISCGSRENTHTPQTNMLWVKDYSYTGGSSANATTTSYISPQLKKLCFFKLSDGPENCYNVTRLLNGHYSVGMFFGLNKDVLADRKPLFDVSIEGTHVYSLKPGWSMNDDQAYVEASVFVLDTVATVCFHSTGHSDTSVMSIKILQLHPQAYDFGAEWGDTAIFRTAKRVDCGVDQSVYGLGGHWRDAKCQAAMWVSCADWDAMWHTVGPIFRLPYQTLKSSIFCIQAEIDEPFTPLRLGRRALSTDATKFSFLPF